MVMLLPGSAKPLTVSWIGEQSLLHFDVAQGGIDVLFGEAELIQANFDEIIV